MVKISAGAENLTSAEILTSRAVQQAGTTGRYSTGETPPIKAEWPEPSDHLRSTCTRGNTIYKDLNESSSARLGGSQQLEILLGNFADAEILPGAEISTSALVLSYIVRRMDFVVSRSFPQKFFRWSFFAEVFRRSFPQQFPAANFRLSFPPKFQASATIFMRRSNFMYFWCFKRTLLFLWFCLILCCKYMCIFSVFIYALCMRQYFLVQLF